MPNRPPNAAPETARSRFTTAPTAPRRKGQSKVASPSAIPITIQLSTSLPIIGWNLLHCECQAGPSWRFRESVQLQNLAQPPLVVLAEAHQDTLPRVYVAECGPRDPRHANLAGVR